MVLAGSVFFLAGVGIIALFGLKRWERTHARTLFPRMRESADRLALRMKALLMQGTQDLEKLPPYILYLLRIGVHVGAMAFGQLAHWIGERSHDLADLVSHKHRFERRPPRSEFLKQVDEYSIKNRVSREGNGFSNLRSAEAPVTDVPVGKTLYEVPPPVSADSVSIESTVAEEEAPLRKTRKRKPKDPAPLGENENI